MKRMKLLFTLLIVTVLVACGQKKTDDTFTKMMYFDQGLTTISITFPDGSKLTSAVGLGTPTTWNTLAGKPATFPPDAHAHSYNDLTDKPQEVELIVAVSDLKGIRPHGYTTAQINALVMTTAEEGMEVYDLTLHVKKYWNGSVWKIIPTTN